MSRIRKVAILIHENEHVPLSPRYIAMAMGEAWRSMGLEVEVVRGLDASAEADLWLPHVDLTVLPGSYRDYLDQRPRVVNRHVIDISKRTISELIVRPGGGYRGPVIVKSNENYGGRPERRLLGEASRPQVGPIRGWLARFRNRRGLGFDPAAPIDPRHYPIYPSPDAVPRGTFEHPDLVVERFVPERDGALYVLRSYAFGGDASVNVRTTSRRAVVKAGGAVHREDVPAPDSILEIRARLCIDYGKLDYVLRDDGRVQLLDVNRTPTFGTFAGDYSAEQRRIARRFAGSLVEAFEKLPADAHER